MQRPLGSSALSCAAIFVLETSLLVARADAGVLYGATASGTSGRLFIINQASGAVVQEIGPLNDASALNYGMTGLAFHPTTGVLYGSTHNLTGASVNPATRARLVTINPSTALVTVVGEYNLPVVPGNPTRAPTMSDIAFDSAGNLYGVGSIGAQLYSIDVGTGQATVIGNAGFDFTQGGGIAVSPAGVIYGTPQADKFGAYNSTLGTFTNIADPVKPIGGSYGALAFDGGTLYGVNKGASAQHIVTIVPATGAVTDIGATVTALDAIAFAPSAAADFNGDGMVDGADLQVWSTNFGLATGATKSLGDANGNFAVEGTDFLKWQTQLTIGGSAAPVATSVPESAAAMLAFMGSVGMTKLARRRSA